MKKTWFIGDTHFYHKNIIKFEDEFRPFDTVEEMNETLVDNWNRVVQPEDTVYHVGDVVFGGHEKHEIIGRLNGKKRLILGNHDRCNYAAPYFEKVYGCMEFSNCIITHIPVHESQY